MSQRIIEASGREVLVGIVANDGDDPALTLDIDNDRFVITSGVADLLARIAETARGRGLLSDGRKLRYYAHGRTYLDHPLRAIAGLPDGYHSISTVMDRETAAEVAHVATPELAQCIAEGLNVLGASSCGLPAWTPVPR